MEFYSSAREAGGVVFTEAGRYAGVLPAERLLALVADRDLAEARDQNPLTRLPGNLRVAEVCASRLGQKGRSHAFAYFDFDNFKPFNDYYGFRNGDRVIMLFADILKSVIKRPAGFVGHLGGDDFFACIEAEGEEGLAPLKEIAQRFRLEASSFYSREDRERGWILGQDRSGAQKRMPLLSVSLAVVLLEPGGDLDPDGLAELLAELKKEAKARDSRFALRTVGGKALAEEEGLAAPARGIYAPRLLLSR